MRYTVLMICDGNICRSPMAALVLSHLMPALDVESAGLSAVIGGKLEPEAAVLLAKRGIDGGAHIARPMNQLMVKSAQLILVMTEQHKDEIEWRYQFSKGRIFRVGEYDGVDIGDPYGRGQLAFDAAFERIERGLEKWIPILRRLEG
jgi:protein-tyrosine phosphatase